MNLTAKKQNDNLSPIIIYKLVKVNLNPLEYPYLPLYKFGFITKKSQMIVTLVHLLYENPASQPQGPH